MCNFCGEVRQGYPEQLLVAAHVRQDPLKEGSVMVKGQVFLLGTLGRAARLRSMFLTDQTNKLLFPFLPGWNSQK